MHKLYNNASSTTLNIQMALERARALRGAKKCRTRIKHAHNYAEDINTENAMLADRRVAEGASP